MANSASAIRAPWFQRAGRRWCAVFAAGAWCLSLFMPPLRGGEFDPVTVRSISGQFIVHGIPQGSSRAPHSGSALAYLRIDPTLTAVSLERIRQTLYGELNLPEKWRGHITVNTFPAAEDDVRITVTSVHYSDGWGYRIEMPEIVDKPRFIRCAVSVILMEFANRNAVTREAELPPWLHEGLSAHLENTALPTLALELGKISGDAARPDPLRAARELVRARGALTFTQLSLPSDAELTGSNRNLYRACSFIFVHELLRLRGGPDSLREMLAQLPAHLNWQTAFLRAFEAHFPRLVDADKWYMLAATHLSGRDSLSVWPFASSLARLDEALATSVQVRTVASDLPLTAQVKLQRLIHEWEPAKQAPVLEQKIIQLDLLRRRASSELVALVAQYQLVIKTYLQRGTLSGRRSREAARQLDQLDEHLQTLRAKLQPPATARATAPGGRE